MGIQRLPGTGRTTSTGPDAVRVCHGDPAFRHGTSALWALQNPTQSVLAPASNHCLTSRRSASLMPVALFIGISFKTTACWYMYWA